MNPTPRVEADLINALEVWLAEVTLDIEKNFGELVQLIGIPHWHACPNGGFKHYPYSAVYRYLRLDESIFMNSKAWPDVERFASLHENLTKHCSTMVRC